MFCPACGHDETRGSACSQCGTILSPGEQKTATEPKPARPTAPPPPQKQAPTTPTKAQKHRSRPLHDLDLTLPELDVANQIKAKPKLEKPKTKIPSPEPAGFDGSRQVEFSTFIFSLGSNALIAMGESRMLGAPQQKSPTDDLNLPQAKEIIDILGLLEEKTKGNLTPQESELLKQTLYTLRTKYVQATKNK